MTRLTLLHTNDLHGHMSVATAERLARLKADSGPCLLFDSGDAVTCGNIGWHRGGEAMHRLMALAGYDALAMGNREYHFRPGPQAAKLRLAPCPVLCANLRPTGWGGSVPQAEFALPGLPRVVVFGLLTPMVTEAMWARHLTASRFDDPLAAARDLLSPPCSPPASGGTDSSPPPRARGGLGWGPAAGGVLPIALTHLGERTDRRLAESCPALRLILGGHSHTPMIERVGQTLICQNEAHGRTVMRVTLDFEDGRLEAVEAEPLALETGRAE
ncbi:MAG: hypothetical protein HZB16_03385 [Armatimonadetes bacterium]|nr:hypothetical protein [Armatimonadota bacterium]